MVVTALQDTQSFSDIPRAKLPRWFQPTFQKQVNAFINTFSNISVILDTFINALCID